MELDWLMGEGKTFSKTLWYNRGDLFHTDPSYEMLLSYRELP